jgi:hypothetical protein
LEKLWLVNWELLVVEGGENFGIGDWEVGEGKG